MQAMADANHEQTQAFINTCRKKYDFSKYSTLHQNMDDRWKNRVLKNGWHLQGVDGAKEYLKKYGKGVREVKLIHLAIFAEKMGYPDYASHLWQLAADEHIIGSLLTTNL